MKKPQTVVFFGVVQDGDKLAVIGYDAKVQPAGKPVGTFPMGLIGMFNALSLADTLTGGLQ